MNCFIAPNLKEGPFQKLAMGKNHHVSGIKDNFSFFTDTCVPKEAQCLSENPGLPTNLHLYNLRVFLLCAESKFSNMLSVLFSKAKGNGGDIYYKVNLSLLFKIQVKVLYLTK